MKLERRTFNDRVDGQLVSRKVLILLPETRAESLLIDEQLGATIPTEVRGVVDLSDGYGQHYIRLEAASQPASKCRRCSECEGCEHHWIEGFPFAECKHCDAKGVDCPQCSTSGECWGAAADNLPCEVCNGAGYLQIHQEKLN